MRVKSATSADYARRCFSASVLLRAALLVLILSIIAVIITVTLFGLSSYSSCIFISDNNVSFSRDGISRLKYEHLQLLQIAKKNFLLGEGNIVDERLQRPLLILVTPTYVRAAQALHFTKLVNTLRVVPAPLLWIVVESRNKTTDTTLLLNRTAGQCKYVGTATSCSKIDYVHLASEARDLYGAIQYAVQPNQWFTPLYPHHAVLGDLSRKHTGPIQSTFLIAETKLQAARLLGPVQHEDPSRSRGVNQRNKALEYIEGHRLDGIVYFMDDDNIYTLELFEEFRKVQRVGILPVAFVSPAAELSDTFVERPLVRRALFFNRSTVIGWETFEWAAADPKMMRRYNTDMAGFAFRSTLLFEPRDKKTGKPKQPIRFHSIPYCVETDFLEQLLAGPLELEVLAEGCQSVLVWHTRLEAAPTLPYPRNWWLSQPTALDLARDDGNNHTARYIMGGKRYYVKGHQGNVPYGFNRPPRQSFN